MDCKRINNLLVDFVDKKLENEQIKMVQEHMAKCKACRQEVEELIVVMNEINKTKDEQPSSGLRESFMQMIEHEKSKTKTIEATPIIESKSINVPFRLLNPMYQIAAGFALLIAGMMMGLLINKNSYDNSEITALQNEMSYMKQVLMLSKLDQPSPSSRIQAVNYMEEISSPDPEVLDALIQTMNTDDNSNVRLAATTALSRFTNNQTVRNALIHSLSIQEDPMVQITLINIMIGLHETKAKTYIENIASNKDTNESVKSIAERGLEILI